MSAGFEQWMSRQAPPVAEDRAAESLLMARINDRFHQRRQVRNGRLTGVVAAVVALIVLGFVDVNPLGSFSRDVVHDPDRPEIVGHPLLPGKTILGDGVTEEMYEHRIEMRAAGLQTMESAMFHRIGDESLWVVGYRLDEPGGVTWVGDPERDQVSNMSTDTSRWLTPLILEFEDDPAHLQWREIPAERHRVDGHELWFRVWVRQTDRGAFYIGTALIP